jgi:hypothetical protein
MNDDTSSKDAFFAQLATLSDAMVAAHGKDFAMGAMVLAARFIAEGEARERKAAEEAQKKPEPSRIISSRIS